MNKSQTSFLAGGDPYLAPFSSMTDGQLRDPKQLVGLARAIDPEGAPERLASGLFVAESVNVIDRALNAGCVPFAVLTDARWLAASEVLLEKVHTANPAATPPNRSPSICGVWADASRSAWRNGRSADEPPVR